MDKYNMDDDYHHNDRNNWIIYQNNSIQYRWVSYLQMITGKNLACIHDA